MIRLSTFLFSGILLLFESHTLLPSWFSSAPKTFSIMLDPAGDAKHTGRKLDDSFERGVTLQCAEKIKALLEQEYPHVRVILTRFPGESSLPLQNANFANRLDVNLYISIHFYQEHETKPHCYIYTFSNGDDFVSAPPELTICPYDKAHLFNYATTQQWATLMTHQLENTHHCAVHGPFHVPFKPLVGIKAPAVAFEIGLKTKDDWQNYSTVIADSLKPIITGGIR